MTLSQQGKDYPIEQSTALTKAQLTTRRDTLATLRGQLAVDTISQKIRELELQDTRELTQLEQRTLQIKKDQLKETLKEAEAARDNARILAEAQITREVLGLQNQISQVQRQRYGTALQSAALQEGEATTYFRRLELEKINFNLQKEELERQRDSHLLLVQEEEKIQAINLLFSAQLALLEEKRAVNDEIIRQNELLRQDSRQAVADQLQLNALQAEARAEGKSEQQTQHVLVSFWALDSGSSIKAISLQQTA